MQAMLGESSFLTRALGCSLRDQQSSASVLRRVDPILDAIGKRIVIVVEDVDRNISEDSMNTLCRLLDEFQEVQNATFFFLKARETPTSIDFHRLCEHTEMVPDIHADDLTRHLQSFVEECVAFAAGKVLLDTDRLRLRGLRVVRSISGRELEENVVWVALCALASTPRSLKHALRRAWTVWRELAGEVDLLELLLWSLLREGCPRGYDFLKNNLVSLRALPRDISSDERKIESIRRMRGKIEDLELPPEQDMAFKVLLTLLGFRVSIHKDESFYSQILLDGYTISKSLPVAPQCLASSGPTDYFRRMEAGELNAGETPDQEILREIQTYQEEGGHQLPSKMAAEHSWACRVAQFDALIPTDRLVDLIEDHTEACGAHLLGRAREESPGFLELHAIWRTRHEAHDVMEGRLESILLSALDYSLELAHGIYHRYVEGYADDLKTQIRDRWVAGLKERIEANAGYLTAAISPDYPHTLFHTMRYRAEYRSYNTPQEWQWLAGHLCASMQLHPDEMAPHVAHLLIRDERYAGGGKGFGFDKEYFLGMCATTELRSRMCSLLLQYARVHSLNDTVTSRIQYVHDDLTGYARAKGLKKDGEFHDSPA